MDTPTFGTDSRSMPPRPPGTHHNPHRPHTPRTPQHPNRRRTAARLIALAAFAGVLAAAAGSAALGRGFGLAMDRRIAPPVKPVPKPPQVMDQALAAQHAFTRRALAAMSENADAKQNIFFSPWSIATALDMARAGSRREALAALRETLSYPDGVGSMESQLDAMRSTVLASATGADAGFIFTQANRMWPSKGLTIRGEYAATLRDRFAADSAAIDFTNKAEAADTINAWVNTNTRGMIPTLVTSDAIPDQGLILTNAVYFLGTWDTPFNKEVTRPQPFTLADGTRVEVPTMFRHDDFQYAQFPGGRAVKLRYTGPASAVLVLPDEGKLEKVTKTFDLAKVNASLWQADVQLWLPKLDLQTRSSIADTLEALGMSPAMRPDADFTGITPAGPTFIADVIHAAAIKMDETKTEAAAATAVVVEVTSAPVQPRKPIEMRFDRPYLLYIVHEPTGAVLFAGRISDPRIK
jgi:serpin B